MRTNLQKWIHWYNLIINKTQAWIDTTGVKEKLGEQIYQVTFTGNLKVLKVTHIWYQAVVDGKKFSLAYNGKAPKRTDVANLKNYYEADLPFDTENITVEVENTKDRYKTTFKLVTIECSEFIFLDKEEAEKLAAELKTKDGLQTVFNRIHKKDENYDYEENGYTFIGWNPSSKIAYQEHRAANHLTYEVSTPDGEHTISCPACKLYWKYDSSG